MLIIGGLELQRVDFVDDVTQIVTRLNFVFDFREDLADFILQGTGVCGGIFELGQVGEELLVDELHEIVAGHSVNLVRFSGGSFGCSPGRPTMEASNDAVIVLVLEFSLEFQLGFKVIKVFEEEQPGGLLDIVELIATTGLVTQNLIDCVESALVFHGKKNLLLSYILQI